MAHITFKQLKYFDALARELHFGRAAESCSVTQPALSMQIHELEESLGLMLVERTRSGVQLTTKGREIADRAARVLGDVRDLVTFAHHASSVLAGTLRLGVIPSVAPYMLPPLLPLLRDAYPELELHVRETQTDVLTNELIEGKLDVILLALPIKHPDLKEMDLFKDRFVLAMPEDKKLSGRVRATADYVEGERLLLLEEGHCLRDQALTYCNLQHVDQFSTFGASSLSTIVEMVSADLGVTLLPELCLGVETRGRDLALAKFAEPEPFRNIGLVWRKTSPRVDDFKELGRLVSQAWNEGPLPKAKAIVSSGGAGPRKKKRKKTVKA